MRTGVSDDLAEAINQIFHHTQLNDNQIAQRVLTTINSTQQAVKLGRFGLCLAGAAVIGRIASQTLSKLQLPRPRSRQSLTALDAPLAGSGLLLIYVSTTVIRHVALTSLSRKVHPRGTRYRYCPPSNH